ncbi:MAG: helix-turn-helix transcriptional regulator [Clostridia bacterium]|nr:helix-turn-helix transcriptional regulator [Clostridia bacterium]
MVREKRLSQVCFFIESTNMNIDEIAALVGYENVSFFYRLFKKTFGVSPKQYRKR